MKGWTNIAIAKKRYAVSRTGPNTIDVQKIFLILLDFVDGLFFTQTVHKFSRIHEWEGFNSSIRGLFADGFRAKPQIPLEPENFFHLINLISPIIAGASLRTYFRDIIPNLFLERHARVGRKELFLMAIAQPFRLSCYIRKSQIYLLLIKYGFSSRSRAWGYCGYIIFSVDVPMPPWK